MESAKSHIVSKSVTAQDFFLKPFSDVRSIHLYAQSRVLRDQYVKGALQAWKCPVSART